MHDPMALTVLFSSRRVSGHCAPIPAVPLASQTSTTAVNLVPAARSRIETISLVLFVDRLLMPCPKGHRQDGKAFAAARRRAFGAGGFSNILPLTHLPFSRTPIKRGFPAARQLWATTNVPSLYKMTNLIKNKLFDDHYENL
jgi:hypothetical protein